MINTHRLELHFHDLGKDQIHTAIQSGQNNPALKNKQQIRLVPTIKGEKKQLHFNSALYPRFELDFRIT